MFLILLLITIVIIFYLIFTLNDKINYSKQKRYRIAKDIKNKLIVSKRASLKLFPPKTIEGNYPILLEPIIQNSSASYTREYFFETDFTIQKNSFVSKKGRAEDMFYSYLNKHFGDDRFSNNLFSVNFNTNLYVPDFMYYDKENQIYIDIEIDEPYTFKEKKPIHYHSQDKRRNDSLVKSGWSVIRFSEHQIINQPDECCKFISDYLKYLYTKDIFHFKENSIMELTTHKCWNKEEAETLALNNSRNEDTSILYAIIDGLDVDSTKIENQEVAIKYNFSKIPIPKDFSFVLKIANELASSQMEFEKICILGYHYAINHKESRSVIINNRETAIVSPVESSTRSYISSLKQKGNILR